MREWSDIVERRVNEKLGKGPACSLVITGKSALYCDFLEWKEDKFHHIHDKKQKHVQGRSLPPLSSHLIRDTSNSTRSDLVCGVRSPYHEEPSGILLLTPATRA
jgi:hypothetical protein